MNNKHLIVREAMKMTLGQVTPPKCVRDGIIKEPMTTESESEQWLKNPLTFEQAKANNEMINRKKMETLKAEEVNPEELLRKWVGQHFGVYLKSATPQVIAAMKEYAAQQVQIHKQPQPTKEQIVDTLKSVWVKDRESNIDAYESVFSSQAEAILKLFNGHELEIKK